MSKCPGVAQVKTRVNRSGWLTVREQCNRILMLPRWVPETPSPVVAQVGPETRGPRKITMDPQSPGQVRPCLGSESPVTGEAHVEPESPGT